MQLCSLEDGSSDGNLEYMGEYLELLCCQPPSERRQAVTEYWIREADRAAARADFATATDLAMKAGWDLGAEPMPLFGDLLGEIESYARQAGRETQAAIAKTHRDCFRSRYGV